MGKLTEQARKRLKSWLVGNPAFGQNNLAPAVGHGQGWVSKYFSGAQQADVDELDAMARALGHTLNELFDCAANEQEQELLDLYRAMPQKQRDSLLVVARAFLPDRPGRKGYRR